MTARWLSLTLFAVVFAPGLLRAQTRFSPARIVYETATNKDKMYEDIEILRRILDRKLHSHYVRHQFQSTGNINLNTGLAPQGGMDYLQTQYLLALPNNVWTYNNLAQGNPAWANNWYQVPVAWQEVVTTTLEGVYLKGQGVIYTATLSSLQPSAKTESAKKPISEWESVRQRVRNEKEEPKKAEANKPPSVSDVLLRVLAENGHHFSQLGENESLTIVLSVHEANPSSTTTKSTGSSAKSESKSAASGSESPSVSSKVSDLELLGDLHMKQEHYGMARDAFREALELKPDRIRAAKLARKLAQAYLLLSEIEKARGALDQAIALTKESTDAKAKPSPAAKPASALPVKMIISAPKKLLEEAKDGKLPFEEFRRRASVETLRFGDRR